jgi:aspartate racemase
MPLLLATRYTMEHGFYTASMAGLAVSVMLPEADDRTAGHTIIFDELCAGFESAGKARPGLA